MQQRGLEREFEGIGSDCCLKQDFAVHALVSICSGLGFQGVGLLFHTQADKIRVVCLLCAQRICLPEKHGKHDDVQEG